MLCRRPYMAGAIPFGCGQCLPCRVNQKRQWMWRQFLESLCHEHNAFVTLTYDRRHIPGNWALQKRHVQLFIKSFRKAIAPVRVCYFAVGEYGAENKRPHYHISLFGVSGYNSVHGRPIADYDYRGLCVGGWVHDCWGRGSVRVDEFNHLTAQYVAGYTVKKLTDWRDKNVWNTPEFALMSNRPGIGAAAMEQIARDLRGVSQSWESGDVPHLLKVGKKSIPLGRYLLKKLREASGFTEQYTREVKDRLSYEKSVEMQVVLNNSSPNSTFKAAYLNDVEGRLIQVEERAKLFKKRG